MSLLPELASAERDAGAMRDWANSIGCTTRLLIGESARRAEVLATLSSVTERLVPGDFLLITFAGHGASLDGVGDDLDGYDEAWCLYDGLLVDDELRDLLAEAPAGSEIVVLTDACFAGGMIEDTALAPPGRRPGEGSRTGVPAASVIGGFVPGASLDDSAFASILGGLAGVDLNSLVFSRGSTRRDADRAISQLVLTGALAPGPLARSRVRRPLRAAITALSAAAEGELAFEGPQHGLFTAALLGAISLERSSELSYAELLALVARAVLGQTPTLTTTGPGGGALSRKTLSEEAGLALVTPPSTPTGSDHPADLFRVPK